MPVPTPYSYRSDPQVPDFPDDKPVVIFDGECVLCSRFAQLILRRDKRKLFRLLAAQQPLGAALYTHYGLHPTDFETNMLIENGRAYFKSECTIRVFTRLGFPWLLVAGLRILPLQLRDRLYDILARNRIRWFGARTCYLPAPADADRFIE